MSEPKIDLIHSLGSVGNLEFGNDAALDAWNRRAEMVIRNVFGEKSKYLKDLENISFHPMVFPTSRQYEIQAWVSGKERASNLIATMADELTLFAGPATQPSRGPSGAASTALGRGVFVVHGHDETMKQSVCVFLSSLGLDPIVLHERPNRGRTIIEKFTEYAAVGFAVVLLSPDDVGAVKLDAPTGLRPRARQNVILELGFFLGKLGRDRVMALAGSDADFELPSDYSGVLFTAFDAPGKWQFDLVRELNAAGYKVDANKLL